MRHLLILLFLFGYVSTAEAEKKRPKPIKFAVDIRISDELPYDDNLKKAIKESLQEINRSIKTIKLRQHELLHVLGAKHIELSERLPNVMTPGSVGFIGDKQKN